MKKSLLCLALAAASVSAQASGTYGGVAISTVDAELSAGGFAESFTVSALSAKLGYAFNDNFALEGVVATGVSGDESAFNSSFEVELDSAFGLNLVAAYPFNDSWSIYGKLGYTDTTFTDSDGDDASTSGATYGFGGAYNLNETVAFDLEYMILPDGEYDDFAIDVESSALNLGVKFNF